MTIKEAILQSLEDTKGVSNYLDIYNHIIKKNYYTFNKDAKTPESRVSALLGDFIRNGDTRVKRIKKDGGTFSYYLSKYEEAIWLDKLNQIAIADKKNNPINSYEERDLHPLLSTFLKSMDVYSKTIFHEKSLNSKDNHQKWIHPDMVGISFANFKIPTTKALIKAINRVDSFKIYSYELKKEINSDYELKQAFFQTVSNSSWANFSCLVAFEISDNLRDEIERLCQSFGVGVIELKANPYESKTLFAPCYKELDFKTIDKLSNTNKDFATFIEFAEKILTASEKYEDATHKELKEFCDKYLKDDAEIDAYRKKKNILYEEPIHLTF